MSLCRVSLHWVFVILNVILVIVMLNVITPNVIVLNVFILIAIMPSIYTLNFVMLSVVASLNRPIRIYNISISKLLALFT